MPGIVGFVSNNLTDEELLDRMIDSVKHKEWQRIDKYAESPFNIARVHLGIFNPEPQPIFNEDKTLCIFMYGKIYDYEEEMEKLKGKYNFIFNNDPEFCLYAYDEYGTSFVKKLNGSFNIVICNFREKNAVIINDRYGLRPIYYTINNGKLLFSSEKKAILQDSTFKKDLNDEVVADFFAFGEILGNKTFFRGIEVIPPATIFTYDYDRRNVLMEQYWNPHYEPDYTKSEDAFVEELIKSLKNAVKRRMKDNFRCGVTLSGGLDSRSVLGAIEKGKRKNIVTITFGIPGCDEAEIAEAVSRVVGTKHIFIPIDPNEVLTPYPERTVYLTEGVFPVHISHQCYAFEKFRSYVDVEFDGLAGALLSGGFLRKQVFKADTNEELLEIIMNRNRVFSDDLMRRLFSDEYYNKIKHMPLQSAKNALENITGHPANRYDYFMLKNHERRLNTKGGAEILRNTVEQVTPMFDNDFFDIILRIPPELRFQHRIYRKLLKKLAPELSKIPYNQTMIRADAPLILWKPARLYQAAKGIFERRTWRISRGKIHLPNKRHYAPVDEWLRVNPNWRKFARDTLLSEDACIKDYCRQEFIETLIEEHESGKANHFAMINQLITFELFLRMFVAGSLQVEPY
jgi:asparagine synthase (glutamine-hydrolysing)